MAQHTVGRYNRGAQVSTSGEFQRLTVVVFRTWRRRSQCEDRCVPPNILPHLVRVRLTDGGSIVSRCSFQLVAQGEAVIRCYCCRGAAERARYNRTSGFGILVENALKKTTTTHTQKSAHSLTTAACSRLNVHIV